MIFLSWHKSSILFLLFVGFIISAIFELGAMPGLLFPAFLLILFLVPGGLARHRMAVELVALIKSGKGLAESFRAIAYLIPPAAKGLLQTAARIESGEGLYETVKDSRDVFPLQLRRTLRVGESAGCVDELIKAYADKSEQEARLSAAYGQGMNYPLIVMAAGAFVVWISFVFIVPVFQSMYSSLGGALPLPTRVTIALSHLLSGGGSMVIILIYLYWRYRFRRGFIGMHTKRMQTYSLAAFTRALLESGLKLEQALVASAYISGVPSYLSEARAIASGAGSGFSVAHLLAKKSRLPDDFLSAIYHSVGDGDIAGALGRLMTDQRAQDDVFLRKTTDRLFVSFVIINGLVFGWIIISMYLPIFGIFKVIG